MHRLKAEGNTITTILKIVGMLSNRTIQQITMRGNWLLLPSHSVCTLKSAAAPLTQLVSAIYTIQKGEGSKV